MDKERELKKISSEIQAGMQLAKCRKCGCMREALENLLASLPLIEVKESRALVARAECWLRQMESVKYACLGCNYCFPAVAMNILDSECTSAGSFGLNCDFEATEDEWPPLAGEYYTFCDGVTCPVAVSTLASIELANNLAKLQPKGLCIVGKTETENIGIDKVVKNTISNPTIHYLIIAGKESRGHYSGRTLLALWENGVDRSMRVINSPGRHPILRNVTVSEVESFRKQVKVIDMIGCEDSEKIIEKIQELSNRAHVTCQLGEGPRPARSAKISIVPKIQANAAKKFDIDKAGYFVIIPCAHKKVIVVEHYGYDNKLLHTIEGKDARSLCSTIIENGWVTELSHATYLGRELAKAELALKDGTKYIQDGA